MERLDVLIESVGIAGLIGIGCIAMLVALVIAMRGSGVTLFLLLITYSLVFVQFGGISSVAFFGRVGCLILLCIGVTKTYRSPGWETSLFLGYVFLGLAFTPFSRYASWSLQRGGLLLLTTVGLTFGMASYIDSPKALRNVCRMYVGAGVVWAAVSLVFLQDFLLSNDLRFQGGGEGNAVGYSLSGATFIPFMLWALMQRGSMILRISGFTSLLVIPVFLFLSGTRTALVIALIATLPLLLKRNSKQLFVIFSTVGLVAASAVTAGSFVLQGRDMRWLSERITTATLSGREERWSYAISQCMRNPLIGRGIGANDFVAGFESGDTIFHNAYLSIWYNTGIVGLALVLIMITIKILAARRLTKTMTDPILADTSRLAFGLILSLTAAALVENSLSSSSNALIANFLIASTLIERIRVLSEQQLEPEQNLDIAARPPRRSVRSSPRLSALAAKP